MHKDLKTTIKIGVVFLIIIGAFIAGFAYNSKQSISQELKIGSYSGNLESGYRPALSLSDLPSGWEIEARGDMTSRDRTQYQRDLGWKEGYSVIFQRVGGSIPITQFISLYPEDNVTLALNETKTKIKQFNEGIGGNKVQYFIDIDSDKYRLDRLANLSLGDESMVYKKSYIDYPNYFLYEIDFVKGNYVVEMSAPDYELLKELAKKVESRMS